MLYKYNEIPEDNTVGGFVEVFDPNQTNPSSPEHLPNVSLKQNWGKNIEIHSKKIFVPRTEQGICNIIKWTKDNEFGKQFKIRTSGYRHTWNHVYTDDKENSILISLLDLKHVASNDSKDLDTSVLTNPNHSKALLRSIQVDENGLCTIGGAVTGNELRQWCTYTGTGGGNYQWTLPLDVILVENTYAGTISSICHGAGPTTKTLSDLVTKIRFVNCRGEIQTISINEEKELIKAAAGSFGLLGIITSLTLKLEPMSYAKLKPKRPNLVNAVPPVKGTRLDKMPSKLRELLYLQLNPAITAEQKQKLLDRSIEKDIPTFIKHCQNTYYSEFFWYILQPQCWLNTWYKDKEENNIKNHQAWTTFGIKELHDINIQIQKRIGKLLEKFNLNREDNKMPPPPFQDEYVGFINSLIMAQLPPDIERNVPLIEALHFQHGIRYVQARNIELQIPVPLNPANNQPDWEICQKAWWDAIYIIYNNLEDKGTVPINLTMEMRIIAGSDVTMAAQRGNHYTCAIGIIANLQAPSQEWQEIGEKIVQKWMSYKDANCKLLNVRPHWGKQWDNLHVKIAEVGGGSKNLNMKAYVKHIYKASIKEFKEKLHKIAKLKGYSLEEMQATFSNKLWDEIIFSELSSEKMPILFDESECKPTTMTGTDA